MAIRKKQSRPIEVNGVRYRWLVSKVRHRAWGDIHVAVEMEEDGGCTLVVEPGFYRPNWDTCEPESWYTKDVTPRMVREWILLALQGGWQPREKGSAFRLVMPRMR